MGAVALSDIPLRDTVMPTGFDAWVKVEMLLGDMVSQVEGWFLLIPLAPVLLPMCGVIRVSILVVIAVMLSSFMQIFSCS